MRHWFAVGLAACAISCYATAASADTRTFKPEWREAYSRLNFKLGMTLDDFRRAPFSGELDEKHAKPICTNDKEATNHFELLILGIEKYMGIVKCSHYYKPKHSFRKRQARLPIADWSAPTTFYFARPSAEEPFVLYKITSFPPRAVFDELLELFKLAISDRPRVAQQLGRYIFWNNTVSSLAFVEFLPNSLRESGLVHTLKPIDAIVEARLSRANEERKNKL